MAASNGSEFFEIEMDQHTDAFPRPSNAEAVVEDEEELMWAALERLPTQKRANFAIMRRNPSRIEGPMVKATFDVRKLDRTAREQLVKNAMVTSDQDNFLLLSGVKERLDRVGMKIPTVEVRFEGLTVSANVLIGKRALPTLVNFCRNGIEALLTSVKIFRPKRHSLTILNNVSGSIKPGRMTLLLGPPGSGKTTLLLALAGKLGRELEKSGKITYNGHTFDEFFIQRTSAYTSQTDIHIAELTVRETLDFAARFQGASYGFGGFLRQLAQLEKKRNVRPNPEIDAFMKASSIEGKKHSLMTDYVLRVLGLDVCADTFVGNEMLRGVSGGQKKRVTTGEMIVGPRKTIFMDEISTGLDSSTTFQIVKSIRNFVHQMEGTVLMALLQPAPETFDLFDDLILLSEGHVVYQGPVSRVIDFFESLGFSLPPRKGVADFLQEVTSKKDQAQYWSDPSKPYVFLPVPEIAAAFRRSEYGKSLNFGLSVPYDKSESLPTALADTEYAVGKKELFKACFLRELVLISRHRFIYIFKTVQVACVGIVTCTMFLRTRLHPTDEVNGNLYLSCLFFGLIHMLFNGFSELPIMITRLPVFFKQRDNSFHPAWAYCIPSWILRLPYSVIEAVVWSCVVYYSVGFAPNVGRFFRFVLLLFSIHQMAVGLFRTLAVLARDTTIANIFASGTLLICFLLGGFMVPKDMIKPWWIWGFWISPLSYGQRAISVNEFGATRWMKKSANGNNSIGYNILHSHSLPTTDKWYWIGVAVLLGYSVLFNIVVIIGLTYLHPLTKSRAIELAEENNGDSAVRSPTVNSNRTPRKGMILPFQPLSLTFHNLNYFVDMPKAMKQVGVREGKLQLLSDVSGVFSPGALTALVGSSGAGKTTLMDVLAGRKTGGYIEGDVRISGYPKEQKTFARISGYVEQSDIHSPQVTVGESLWFSASLRLPKEIDEEKKREFVDEVMTLVELGTLRDALVGLPGTSGLSTEQRKRLTIAVELVANPSIIFMDEPTSGLDARAAAIVMRTVRNTVDTGRTVVCTIHQPSIDIFEAFDELLLMKRGGRVIYGGKLGVDSNIMIDYFQRIDGVPPIPEGYNPATWMLEVTTQACEERIGEDFAILYKNSNQYREVEKLIEEMSVPATGSEPLHFTTEYPQNSLTQFKICLWKQNLVYWRTPHYNVVKLFFAILSGLILGSVFWGVGSRRNSTQDLLTAMGAIYASCMFLGVNNSQSIQPVISIERTVFYRERAAGLYSPFPYAAAQGLIEVPYLLAQAIMYGLLTYFMMDFERTIGKFLLYIVFMFLTFAYFTCYGMMAVGLTPNQQLSAVLASAFYSLWNLMSGFLIPKPRMPIWWVWFHYIDPIAWTLRGVITSQFGDVESPIVGPGFTGSVGEYVKSYLGFEEKGLVGISVVVLLLFVFLFFGSYATAIRVLNFQRR